MLHLCGEYLIIFFGIGWVILLTDTQKIVDYSIKCQMVTWKIRIGSLILPNLSSRKLSDVNT